MEEEMIRVRVVKNAQNDAFMKRIEEFVVNISRDSLLLLPVAYKMDSTVDLSRDDYEMLTSLGLEMEIIENIQNRDERSRESERKENRSSNLDENPIRDYNDRDNDSNRQNTTQSATVNDKNESNQERLDEDKEKAVGKENDEDSEIKPFTAETEEEKKKQEEFGREFDEKEAPQLREELEKQGKKPEEVNEAIDQAKTEYIGKFYYLTPDTILDNLKKVNGGTFWDYLRVNGMQDAVERAYRGCVWPSELSNPDFLENVISDYLPAGNQVDKTGLKHIHTMALSRTFVGYQVEEVNASEEKTDDGKGEEDIAIVNLPETVEQMPEDLKNEVRKDTYINMTKIIQSVLNDNSKYTAICALVPMENVFAEALEMTEKQYNEKDVTEGKKVAIVQAMDYTKGYRDQLKNDSQGFNLNFAIGDIDWQNPEERQKTIELIKMISGRKEMQGIVDEKTIKNADVFFVINSEADVLKLRETKNSLEALGANVRMQYINNAPPEQKQEIEKAIKSEVGIDAKPAALTPMVERSERNLLMGAIGATMAVAGMAMNIPQEKSEEELRNEEAIQNSSIDQYADSLEKGTIDKDYAVYLLSMEADVTPEVAEQELFEAYMTAHEEAEMARNMENNNPDETQE